MQYDLARFSVKPGTYVRLILINKDDMEHNMVLGKQNSRQAIVAIAQALGKDGPAMGYIPKSDLILTSIPLLHVGQADSVLFRAPRNTGVYPYVCTFPGHGSIMYGAMHVTNGVMPEIMADTDIPPHRRKVTGSAVQDPLPGHPFKLNPPYLYRVLMPDAGPASIAVCLPNNINYCWDAGVCRLRYLWEGGFLDLTDYWTIKGEPHAKILGNRFYHDSLNFNFRIGHSESIPKVQFKGYRLVKDYPEYHYYIDDIEVFELIHDLDHGPGIVREFRMNHVNQSIEFIHQQKDGMIYRYNKGKIKEDRVELNPTEAASFSITMLKGNK
jgi:plastocyanin